MNNARQLLVDTGFFNQIAVNYLFKTHGIRMEKCQVIWNGSLGIKHILRLGLAALTKNRSSEWGNVNALHSFWVLCKYQGCVYPYREHALQKTLKMRYNSFYIAFCQPGVVMVYHSFRQHSTVALSLLVIRGETLYHGGEKHLLGFTHEKTSFIHSLLPTQLRWHVLRTG